MVLRLVQNTETGQYDYQNIYKPVKPAINTAAFEAYEGDTKTTLATGGTNLGAQTDKLIRELPGTLTTDVDPTTGEVPAGASTTDPTGAGGGNIGTGNVPMPGEAGFTSPNIKPPGSEQTQ